MSQDILVAVRALARCTHDAPDDVSSLVCSLCGATRLSRGEYQHWTRPSLVGQLVTLPDVEALCALDEFSFKRFIGIADVAVASLEPSKVERLSQYFSTSPLRPVLRADAPQAFVASVGNPRYEPAPTGTTCEMPTREAWEAARRQNPQGGIDDSALFPKCGKVARVLITTRFTKTLSHRHYCEEHWPKYGAPL